MADLCVRTGGRRADLPPCLVPTNRSDLTALYVPVSDLASSVGLNAAANMVMLGAYLTYTRVMDVEILSETIRKHLKKRDLIEQNLAAVQKGIEYIKQNYS